MEANPKSDRPFWKIVLERWVWVVTSTSLAAGLTIASLFGVGIPFVVSILVFFLGITLALFAAGYEVHALYQNEKRARLQEVGDLRLQLTTIKNKKTASIPDIHEKIEIIAGKFDGLFEEMRLAGRRIDSLEEFAILVFRLPRVVELFKGVNDCQHVRDDRQTKAVEFCQQWIAKWLSPGALTEMVVKADVPLNELDGIMLQFDDNA